MVLRFLLVIPDSLNVWRTAWFFLCIALHVTLLNSPVQFDRHPGDADGRRLGTAGPSN
jgi:hypothetical protein